MYHVNRVKKTFDSDKIKETSSSPYLSCMKRVKETSNKRQITKNYKTHVLVYCDWKRLEL